MDIKIQLANPCIGEEEARAVYEVVLSGWISEGKKVKEFEERFAEYIGVKHAIALFNGTVALHAILLAHDIGPGDEVIVPSFTFISTATSVLHVGATPVFADIDHRTYNIDPNDIEHRITKKTKAIMPVHYAGQSADMFQILEIAEKYGLFVFEDAAEAHGAEYHGKKVGSFGNAAMFSFTPTKNITTSEGGMVTTNNDKIAEKIRLLKNHGQDYQYHHIVVGYNYRMTDMQGAMGVEQLKKLPSIIAQKQQNAEILTSELDKIEGIIPPYVASNCNHTYMLYTIKVDSRKLGISREMLMQKLGEKGIQTKIYFHPAHLQPIFMDSSCNKRIVPVTERVSKMVLSLPFHSKLERKDLEYFLFSLKDVISFSQRHG